MTISEILQYCMSKPGAEQSVHSDWKATQIKVGGCVVRDGERGGCAACGITENQS